MSWEWRKDERGSSCLDMRARCVDDMRAWSASAAELLSFHFKYERFDTAYRLIEVLPAHHFWFPVFHSFKVINLKSWDVVTTRDVQLHIHTPMATSSKHPPYKWLWFVWMRLDGLAADAVSLCLINRGGAVGTLLFLSKQEERIIDTKIS